MAVFSAEHGFLFVQAPKAASSSIEALLTERHGGRRRPDGTVRGPDGSIVVRRKHATLAELVSGGVFTDAEIRGLFTFVSVRNPFDALVSMWTRAGDRVREAEADPEHWLHLEPGRLDQRRRMASLSFEEWIGARFSRRRSASLYLPFVAGVDFVVRFERLDEDLAVALARVGLEHEPPLRVVNATPGRDPDHRSSYTPALRAMIESVFAEELDRLGYGFDGPIDAAAPAR